MKDNVMKRIGILLSTVLLLTACGQPENQSAAISSASEISTEETSATAAVTPDATSVPASQAGTDDTPLSADPSSVGGEILVANLRGEDSYLSERVITFSRENPAYGIQYQPAWKEEEVDRILMETANGNGPDILFLTRQDMESLQEGGVLGDLGQLISQDTLEALLPGVIQMGTYEGELNAVPLAVSVRTIITNRDYWQENTWTIEDIVSVLQEHSELQGLFVDMTGQDTFSYNMYYLVGMDIKNSVFIRDGNSGFDSEEFRSLLELVKERSQKANNNSTPSNRLLPIMEGEYLGVGYYIANMKMLCDIYEKMGDTANLVGYPSEAGNCHYLSDYGVLVVKDTAMEKAGVKELVNDLLSLESQQMLKYQISVRRDIPEAQVAYSSTNETWFWQSPNFSGYPLAAKEDGSSYLEEYLELLESAVPIAVGSDDIFDLVMEETESYFQGDKDLDTVVNIIQKRVQLYLDEKK